MKEVNMKEISAKKIESFNINTLFNCYKKFLNCEENIFKININDKNNVLRLGKSFTEIFKEEVLKGNKLNILDMNIEDNIKYQIKEFIEQEDGEEYQYQYGIAYPIISINERNGINNSYIAEIIKEINLNSLIALNIYPIVRQNNEILVMPEKVEKNEKFIIMIDNLVRKHPAVERRENNKILIEKSTIFDIVSKIILETFNISFVPINLLIFIIIELIKKKELQQSILNTINEIINKNAEVLKIQREISQGHGAISYLIRYTNKNATNFILKDLEIFERNKTKDVKNKLLILTNLSVNSIKEKEENVILIPTKNKLTPSQQKAFNRIIDQKITLIEGPPGTGKSVLITAICSSYLCADKKVVVSSTNNKAVDSVYEKLKEFDEIYTEKYKKSEFYLKGYIRLGAQYYYNKFLNEEVEIFLENVEKAKKENNTIIEEIKSELNELSKFFSLAVIKENLKKEHESLFDIDFEYIKDNKYELKSVINYLYKVKSFKFKIPLFGNIFFRSYFQKIIQDFEKLKIKYNKEELLNKRKIDKIKDLINHLNLLKKYIIKLDNDIDEYENLLDKFKKKYSLTSDENEENDIINELKKIYLVRKKEYLFWKLIRDQEFLNDLKALYESKDKNPHKFKNLYFQFAPIILTTALSAPKYLKTDINNIDLVIIDEASQTLFLYVFPLFLRAKKFVVIGDKNQLEPVLPSYFNSLQIELEDELEKLPKFLWPDKSAFHVIEHIEEVTLSTDPKDRRLLEHFRCAPSIIKFCDQLIGYGLEVMSNDSKYEFKQPLSKEQKELQDIFSYNIVFINVNGKAEDIGSKYNKEEVEFIVKLVNILSNHLNDSKDIAIITPYKRQEELIKQEIKKLNLTDITVGTIHKLQGDEKDIIILSLVATREKDFQSKFFNNKNLINVAVSRAKKHLIVVGNENSIKNLEDNHIIKKLYKHISGNGKVFSHPPHLYP